MTKARLNLRLSFALLMGVALLGGLPLLLMDAEFAGADAQAEELIGEVAPDYEPWATPVFEPQSSEVESLLFALQAALGAGVMGFVVGQYSERHRQQLGQARQPEDS